MEVEQTNFRRNSYEKHFYKVFLYFVDIYLYLYNSYLSTNLLFKRLSRSSLECVVSVLYAVCVWAQCSVYSPCMGFSSPNALITCTINLSPGRRRHDLLVSLRLSQGQRSPGKSIPPELYTRVALFQSVYPFLWQMKVISVALAFEQRDSKDVR